MTKDKDYSKISSTAVFCARMRAKYDIPFAKEIIRLIDNQYSNYIDDLPDYGGTLKSKNNFLSFIEGRFYSLNRALEDLNKAFILELASGLSPRSLMFLDRKNISYLESDLKEVIYLKKQIINKIIKKRDLINKNLFFMDINPLKKRDIDKLGRFYLDNADNKRLVVINEGLTMYLNPEEKIKLTKNIKHLFKDYSKEGIWLTPDFSRIKKKSRTPKGKENIRERIKKVTKRDFDYFDSINEAKNFLDKGGFDSHILPNKDIVLKLIKSKGLEHKQKEILEASSGYKVWKIRLRE